MAPKGMKSTEWKRIDEEMRRAVADAIENHTVLKPAHEAEQIAQRHPVLELSPCEIAEEIIRLAIHAGVPTELSRTK